MNLRYLSGLVDLPYVTPSGSLVSRVGYNAQTQIYLNVPIDYKANIPPVPCVDDLSNALTTICQPWRGYRLSTPEDAAALLSGIFAAVLRPVMPLCPAYLIDAPAQAAGKTKLALSLGGLVEGRVSAVTPYSGGSKTDADVELKKRIIAGILVGARFHCIDNLVGHFKSPTLASCLTSGRLVDRELQFSRLVDGSMRSLVTLTANNASLDADLSRRTVQVRIDGGENAATRHFAFDPVSLALSMRMSIAEAVCTIVMAYINAGSPSMATNATGGFDDWDVLCRQTVMWAVEQAGGVLPWNATGDPAASLLRDPSRFDPEIQILSEIYEALHVLSAGEFFTSKDAMKWFNQGRDSIGGEAPSAFHSAVTEIPRNGTGPLSSRGLGRILAFRREKSIDGRKLISSDSGRVTFWKVVSVDAG